MVQRGRDIGELHEIAEILDRGIAPAIVEIADEGRPVDGREDRGFAADVDVALRISRVLDELPRRRLDAANARAPWESAPASPCDVGPAVPPHAAAPPGSSRKSTPISWSTISALFSISSRPSSLQHLVERHLPLDVGQLPDLAAVRSARRASAPPRPRRGGRTAPAIACPVSLMAVILRFLWSDCLRSALDSGGKGNVQPWPGSDAKGNTGRRQASVAGKTLTPPK